MVTFARAAVASLMLAAIGAQQKPDFSGRWVMVSPAQGAGAEQVVKHNDKTLTIEHLSSGGSHRQAYEIDGVEHRSTLASRGQEIVTLYTASWDGTRLVIASRTTYPNGMKTQSKEIWSLDAQGRLVIDYTESGPGGQPGPATKVTYVKKQ